MDFNDFNQRFIDVLETGMTHSLSFELRRLSTEQRREIILFYSSIFDKTKD